MDFLDPKKQRRHAIMLLAGYGLISIAILLATIVLLEFAYGYNIGKGGEVVQNGLLFVSSTPNGASIDLNGHPTQARTNARLSLVSGSYQVGISRTGYQPWLQSFNLVGGSVYRIDYPFLFPKQLTTNTVKTYGSLGMATQSPDRRWLLVQLSDSSSDFDLYDLKNTKNLSPVQLSLPSTIVSSGSNHTWTLVEWADDNQHVLLSHIVDGKTEFVLIDRTDASKSVNLNQALNTSPTKLTLLDKKYDQYYVYDGASQALQSSRLNAPALQPVAVNVLTYHSYGSNVVLYASSKSATSGKVAINLLQGGKSYLLREVAANTSYLLDVTRFNNNWFVVVGASSENKAYVYKNPATQLGSKLGTLVPVYVFKTPNPTYVSFSGSAQYVMAENGSQFAVYDVFYDKGYGYDTALTLDQPQEHAAWMDSARLQYVTGGKLVVFDFDGSNRHTLVAASPSFIPFFTPDYKFVQTFAPAGSTGQINLTNTSLRTPADQ